LTFWNSDVLSSFTCTIEGFSDNGLVGGATHQYYTQMPFSLDSKVPVAFLSGDQVKIPITLTNNMDRAIEGELEVTVPDCFNLIQAVETNFVLQVGESRSVYPEYEVSFDCPRGLSKQQIEVRFKSNNTSDAFTQGISVNSSSYPIHKLFTGSENNNVFDLNISNPQKGSLQLKLKAHPNVASEVMASLERMIRQPHGCFEQTSSYNYPNLLVMQYMKKNRNQFNQAIYNKAEKVLDFGYKRLMGFEVKSGGFQWWGKNPAHEALTAYGLMEFVDMKSVYPVEEAMLKRTADWLLKRRDGKGSWKHPSKGKSYWFGSNEVRDAYIVWSLSEAGYGPKISKELEKSYRDAQSTKDPYIMAAVANALFQVKDARAESLLDSILVLQNPETGQFKGLSTSITTSKGKNLHIETTALCAIAMLESNHIDEVALFKAIQFLIKSKNFSGYGSTQATVLSIKALVEYTELNQRKDLKKDGAIELLVDGQVIRKAIPFNRRQRETIVVDDLAQYIGEGRHQVEVRFAASGKILPFELELSYNSKLPPAQESACKISLSTLMKRGQVPQGETVRLTSHLTNQTDEGQASPLAIIGIPAGLSPQPWQLKEIQEKGLIDYYEVMDDRVVFYFEALTANETKTIHLDLKADIPGTFEASPSCAYLYYENDVIDWVEPNEVEVLIN